MLGEKHAERTTKYLFFSRIKLYATYIFYGEADFSGDINMQTAKIKKSVI